MRGGLRTRLVVDSLRVAIIAGLDTLGWFDTGRRHRPLHYISRPNSWDDSVEPNSFAISTEDISDEPQGFGGDVEDVIHVYIDIFAENSDLGWHLAGDIRDLLLGQIPATGRTGPVVDAYDFRLATPAPFTQIDIDSITIDRADGSAREWYRNWFMIRIDLVDDYSDEFEATHTTTDWADDLASAWDRIQIAETVP